MSAEIRWTGGDPYELALREARYIMQSRQGIYSDNWALMSFESLLYAAIYKLERARFTEDPHKRLDDLLDAFNYVVFAIARVLARYNEEVVKSK